MWKEKEWEPEKHSRGTYSTQAFCSICMLIDTLMIARQDNHSSDSCDARNDKYSSMTMEDD